jgi:hypothetical protein
MRCLLDDVVARHTLRPVPPPSLPYRLLEAWRPWMRCLLDGVVARHPSEPVPPPPHLYLIGG